jgi:GxxExxY protein
MNSPDLTYDVIGAAMEVHRELGPGLREQPYENALRNELRIRSYQVDQQRAWPIHYKGEIVGDCFTDLVVNGGLVIEVKAIAKLGDEEMGQILNYLRISKKRIELILNFKPKSLEVKRVAR